MLSEIYAIDLVAFEMYKSESSAYGDSFGSGNAHIGIPPYGQTAAVKVDSPGLCHGQKENVQTNCYCFINRHARNEKKKSIFAKGFSVSYKTNISGSGGDVTHMK